ncbi:long-chain fatty acid transport protein 1-like isoform X2 [Varroa jacobsoni]|uniref:Very long-chain fatty acid transport protein n=1 Tax=Varroa destructor TaxID=109461 RepID=A0A7M7J5T9_VARDE|nr:long-chain fatty acid transport protein 1-like isoform X2 [Varroa destructor]XP_022704248.1 long-chain fatty acid transport protein 1-like isoform X2 [Varroa jacobsoni]
MWLKVAGGWRFLWIVWVTGWRDLRGLIRLLHTAVYFRSAVRNNRTVAELFEKSVKRWPNRIAFRCDDTRWTFKEVEEQSNRVANCFLQLGFKPGDEVCLFMDSRPEFVMMWLGLSKIGVVSALVNNNLRLQPLVHSLSSVPAKAFVFGPNQASGMNDIAGEILAHNKELKFFCYGTADVAPELHSMNLEKLLETSSSDRPQLNYKGSIHDKLVYIYTSGTTGLPKAAIIKQSRFISMASIASNIMPVKSNDIFYTCLPLYHTAGGIVVVSQALLFGNTVCIRPKFSASKFWDDCIKYEATVTQYIGEICRYLLAQPEKPQDKQHRIRMMFGNGLRPQIWTEFSQRFNITNLREFYGSTEGNAHVMNIDNTVGAVGFVSRIAENVHPVRLIRIDESTGLPMRNGKGLCIPCQPGQVGELVGVIRVNDHIHSFDGYASQQATSKKMYRDVFRKDDAVFASGDLLVMDEFGYLFFKDRTGDTFRWKGENVSTSEVEGIAARILNMVDVVCYGVPLPGSEGRAGMIAVADANDAFDLNHFLSEIRLSLPAYAVPLFVRKLRQVDTTGTYKLKKVELQKEGFDINLTKDPIYFLKDEAYIRIDQHLLQQINDCKIRV